MIPSIQSGNWGIKYQKLNCFHLTINEYLILNIYLWASNSSKLSNIHKKPNLDYYNPLAWPFATSLPVFLPFLTFFGSSSLTTILSSLITIICYLSDLLPLCFTYFYPLLLTITISYLNKSTLTVPKLKYKS